MIELRYLEFYSGVGGWTMAIDQACRTINSQEETRGSTIRFHGKRLASFDHSDLCNRVLDYNFNDGDDDDDDGDCSGDDGDKKNKNNNNTFISGKKQNRNERRESSSSRSKKSTKRTSIAIERLTKTQLQNFDAFLWSMSPPWYVFTINVLAAVLFVCIPMRTNMINLKLLDHNCFIRGRFRSFFHLGYNLVYGGEKIHLEPSLILNIIQSPMRWISCCFLYRTSTLCQKLICKRDMITK